MKIPRFTHPKKQGEWAELVFMARAAALGYNVLRPHGDCMPFDVVLERNQRFIRIQVKSVAKRKSDRGNYYVNVGHIGPARVPYSSREVDFLAVLVIPQDLWYIIPVRAVRRRQGIWICPINKKLSLEFERYREAWYLLRVKKNS